MNNMIEDLREIGRSIIIAALIFIILQFLIQNYVVKGKSMFPNLEDGQRVLVNKFIYQRTIDFDKDYVGQGKEFIFGGPQRDEIVVFKSPHNYQKEALVKRIIGLPGDWVEIKDGVVLVNNNPLPSDFGFTSSISFDSKMKVPESMYFVLGDNRNHSNDSRLFGFISSENIIGRVWITYWPFPEFKVFG